MCIRDSIRIECRHGREMLAGIRTFDLADAVVDLRQIAAGKGPQRQEGESGGAGLEARHHAEVRVLLELERLRFGDRMRTRIDVDPALLEVRVPPMSLPPLDDRPDNLLQYEAVQLFVDRARQHRQEFDLEQLIGAVRQLDAESRSIVLDALLDEDLDHRLDLFIERLARKPPSDDLSDEEINEIVHEVRRERRGW